MLVKICKYETVTSSIFTYTQMAGVRLSHNCCASFPSTTPLTPLGFCLLINKYCKGKGLQPHLYLSAGSEILLPLYTGRSSCQKPFTVFHRLLSLSLICFHYGCISYSEANLQLCFPCLLSLSGRNVVLIRTRFSVSVEDSLGVRGMERDREREKER